MSSILLLGQISLNRDVKCVWESASARERETESERAAHSLNAPLSYQKPLHY